MARVKQTKPIQKEKGTLHSQPYKQLRRFCDNRKQEIESANNIFKVSSQSKKIVRLGDNEQILQLANNAVVWYKVNHDQITDTGNNNDETRQKQQNQ